ncbi:hypothetical protein ACJX0J_008172, partial [Zea mays]
PKIAPFPLFPPILGCLVSKSHGILYMEDNVHDVYANITNIVTILFSWKNIPVLNDIHNLCSRSLHAGSIPYNDALLYMEDNMHDVYANITNIVTILFSWKNIPVLNEIHNLCRRSLRIQISRPD